MTASRSGLLLLLLAAGCAAPPEPERAAYSGKQPLQLEYQVEYDQRALRVSLRIEHAAEGRWILANGDIGRIRVLDHGDPHRPRMGSSTVPGLEPDRDGGVTIPAGSRSISYTYPLAQIVDEEGHGMRRGLGAPGAHLVSGNAYLLRPEWIPDDVEVRLRFGGAARPLVPWSSPPDGVYRLGCDDLIGPGFHTFGGARHRIPIGTREVELAILPGAFRASQDEQVAWIRQAASEIAALRGGELPVERLAVTLIPVEGDREASRFGQLLFSQPPSIAILAGERARAEDLREDWVVVHEMSHALLPRLHPDHAWFTEGFASWLQQVARVRSGRLDERTAWEDVVVGCRHGVREAGGTNLGELSEQLSRRHAYRAVYWGGALFALELDLELRRITRGKVGLPELLAQLCAEVGAECDLAAVAAKVDAVAGQPLFKRLCERHLDGEPLALKDELFPALGVTVGRNGKVRLDDGAPRAAERRAAMGAGQR